MICKNLVLIYWHNNSLLDNLYISYTIDYMRLKLSDSQLSTLSDICLEIGAIALASVVLPAVLDTFRPLPAIFGFLTSLIFWTISIILSKGKGKI